MSSAFRLGLAKKKATQHDLRKLMNQQKAKAAETKTRIDSPLAKYPLQTSTITNVSNHYSRQT